MFYVADMLLFVLTTKIIYMFPVVLLFVCGGGLAGGDVQYCRSINTIYIFFLKHGPHYSTDCVHGICNDVWNWILYVCNGCY